MPQDEYDYATVMDDWIVASGIDVVYSVLAPENWPIIYPRASRVAQMEKTLILDTLSHCLGNRTHAANILGISIRTLRNKLNEYADEGTAIPAPQSGIARFTP